MQSLISYSVWAVSIVATLGSLFFSEIRGFVPCTLCWYQRILMYPLVLIIFMGIYTKDKSFPKYVLPLSILGGAISLYHYLLQQGVITASATCEFGATCAYKFVNYLGFITIPFMALSAFTLISIGMFYLLKSGQPASQA